jgi:drug/metabolite transporter (DMT)-like permease
MTLPNLVLILASAMVHVVAHVALKRARDRAAFVWWMLVWGGVLFAPVLVLGHPSVPAAAWAIMAVSGACEVLYFLAIARAYRLGDLSLVYPLARGTAPLFLLLWTTLFLADHITPGGVAGIAVIAIGLYLINLPGLGAWLQPLRQLSQPAPLTALAAGLCISLYTFIDRGGIQLVEPLLYTYLTLWITLLFITPLTLRQVGWAGLRAELGASRLSSVLAGFTTMAAYTMVLYAIRFGTPASYAGAVREISVVFGAAIGVTLLHERGSAMRVAGAVGVAAGVALIALFG